MSNAKLPDPQWDKILTFLKRQRGIYSGHEQRCRQCVEAVLWMLRSGAQWRLLPEAAGKWNSGYRRFIRWGNKDIGETMHRFFAGESDLESIMLDSTVVRAHAGTAGAEKKTKMANLA